MPHEDQDPTAHDQREEANVLSRSIIAVLKTICGAMTVAMVAVLGVAIQDHYVILQLSTTLSQVTTLVAAQGVKIDDLQHAKIPAATRWTYGMQLDFGSTLKSINPTLTVPSTEQIHDSHFREITQ